MFKQRKKPVLLHRLLLYVKSNSSLNLAGTQAAGAYVNGLSCAVYDSLNASDVGLPGSIGLSVRMGNSLSELNSLSTNAALCHCYYLRYLSRYVGLA